MMPDYYFPFDRSVRLGQQFGWNPGLGPNPPGGHNGDDWLTPVGTLVRSAGDGVVVFAGEFDSTYEDNWGWNLHYGGKMVVLNMDGDTAPYFEYGHNSQILVKTGDRVRAGQGIAITGNTDGNTGVSTGPHCHVGCLPWNFNLGSNTYGRVNPRLYMTRYWDAAGSLSYASESTTPLQEEGFLMALTDAQQARILAAADRINGVITDPTAKVLTEAHLPDVATHVLNTTIPRGGAGAGIGDGLTSLGAMVAWNDDHTIQLLAAAAATAAQEGGTVEEIKAAVVEALKENVVKVDVSVAGQEAGQ